MDFFILLGITGLLFVFSLVKDKQKTKKALKIAGKRIIKIGIPLLSVIIIISILNWFFPPEAIVSALDSGSRWTAFFSASFLGSIAVMPGFIAFPLGGMLRSSGVPYMIIAAFTSTLMMVGLSTIAVEKEYLGFRVSLLRNAVAFLISLTVAFITGIVFGEIHF